MRIAVPTDDGVTISERFGRTRNFLVAEVSLGQIMKTELRQNPRNGQKTEVDPTVLVSRVLEDCRVAIVRNIGERMREALESSGVEVVLTSEHLLDRAVALFSLTALVDESISNEDEDESLLSDEDLGEPELDPTDEFDG